MAEGFLKHFYPGYKIFSAGTKPENEVNRFAVKVMNESGIDISQQIPKNVNIFTNDSFDYLVTVCDNAKENCPIFTRKVINKLHIGFEDPSHASGTEEFIMSEFRRVRDQIEAQFRKLYEMNLKID